jgi:hydroxymethylpyrimidine pyrophosphatase-like HAD family hydrolase
VAGDGNETRVIVVRGTIWSRRKGVDRKVNRAIKRLKAQGYEVIWLTDRDGSGTRRIVVTKKR